jgi:putative two-component system response regulator
MPKILIADDDKVSRKLLQIITADCCETVITDNGIDAYKYANSGEHFDMILLDINMPGLDGYEVCKKIKANDRIAQTPVIFISGNRDDDAVVKGLELGAVDYITKPLKGAIIRARLQTHLQLKKYQDNLENLVAERTTKLLAAEEGIRQSQEETIYRLAKAAEFRDNETALHTLRMAHYCRILALRSGYSQEESEKIRLASQLHDVGKIGISDTILLKPGKLTKEEFETIKQHADIGWRILADSDSEVVNLGGLIARTHHEKFNGSGGYPQGTSGENIPIEGRIAAICDVFDALTSDRVYKMALSVEESMQIMRKDKGSHFDPDLFDKFEESMDEILRIKTEFADK